jgi:hypothetical protein
VSSPPRHTSLETQFTAAVPAQRAPLLQRAMWWLTLRAMALRPVQKIIEKKYRA